MTGGGSGIGRALALQLARASDLVVVVAGRRADRLEETCALGSAGTILPVACDVASRESRLRLVERVRALGAPVRFLVHNAAVLGPVGSMATVGEEEWRAVMDTNVNGPLALTLQLLDLMQDGARVLHVSSGAAHRYMKGTVRRAAAWRERRLGGSDSGCRLCV